MGRTNEQFHTYTTHWDRLGRRTRKERYGGHDFKKFYGDAIEEARRRDIVHGVEGELVGEHNWLAVGRPYYKLWSSYAMMLANTTIDLPTSVLKMPYHAFAVHMPRELAMVQFDFEGRRLEIRSFLVSLTLSVKYEGLPSLSVIVDDGEDDRSMLHLILRENESFEDSMRRSLQVPLIGRTSIELLGIALRLALAVALLAISAHRSVEHDIIAALREEYDDPGTETGRRQQIVLVSRSRGFTGCTIGRELSLRTAKAEESSPSGRSLHWSHVRGGHFHRVRYGPDRSKVRVMFFEPTIVRPDLPSKPLR